MTGYRQTLIVLLLTILSGVTVAQNNTNSPYTRYGYGQLTDQGAGNSKGMGGIAYGLRDKYQTNFVNPASYTAIDSLTFLFDGGVSLQNTNLSDGTVKMNVKNSSFDYITMQFRLGKWCAMSLGLLPYSNIGYSIGEYRPNADYPNNSSTVTYAGDGGLHQLYFGAGFKVLKNLSVGANISYLWGDLTRTRTQQFPLQPTFSGLKNETDVAIKSYKLDVGVQYTHQFTKKHAATWGVVFSPGHDLNNETVMLSQMTNPTSGSSVTQKDTLATYGIPLSLGAGVTYVYDNRLTVGLDVLYQKWGNVTYMDTPDAFCDRTKISAGAEYMPSYTGRSYFSHIKYRLGAYYSKPYYKIDGARAANEYGLTAGFGLPIPRTRSVLSLSAQYVRTDGTKSNFLNENTLRICIGVTFNERWFLKRKVD